MKMIFYIFLGIFIFSKNVSFAQEERKNLPTIINYWPLEVPGIIIPVKRRELKFSEKINDLDGKIIKDEFSSSDYMKIYYITRLAEKWYDKNKSKNVVLNKIKKHIKKSFVEFDDTLKISLGHLYSETNWILNSNNDTVFFLNIKDVHTSSISNSLPLDYFVKYHVKVDSVVGNTLNYITLSIDIEQSILFYDIDFKNIKKTFDKRFSNSFGRYVSANFYSLRKENYNSSLRFIFIIVSGYDLKKEQAVLSIDLVGTSINNFDYDTGNIGIGRRYIKTTNWNVKTYIEELNLNLQKWVNTIPH